MRQTSAAKGAVLAALLILLLGCDSGRKAKSERRPPEGPAMLESADVSEVIPVADGGAYARSLWGDLWYLREGQAVKVSGLPGRDYLIFAVMPTADGGAYLVGFGAGTWYLRGSVATKVREVPVLSGATIPSHSREKWLWALLQAEMGRRRAAEVASETEPSE